MNKILVVRTDRVGDVMLTTPISSALRAHFPQSQIHWLVRSYTEPLLRHNPAIDRVIPDDGGPVGPLIERLKSEAYDAAIVAYPRWRTAWALWKANVPIRIGPASKPYSLLFSQRVWQHRSRGEKHEAEYNLELLIPLGVPFRRFPTRLVLTDEERASAKKQLKGFRISFDKPLVFLHPGSGGSSARWPLSSFMELGDRLQESGCDVVVTGGPGEEYQYKMIDHMRRPPMVIAAGSVGLRELGALFSWGNLLVSNSTGPLHMAVALGVPTVSVYSPTATCHPKRWGPYPDFIEGRQQHDVEVAPMDAEGRENMAAVPVDRIEALCLNKLKITRETKATA